MLCPSVSVVTCMFLLLTLCPDVLSRRGGFGSLGGRWGGAGRAGAGGGWGGTGVHRGAGHHYRAPGGSSTGTKIAGAAAAGALGGMVIGHGLGSMSRSGYGYGHGSGYGYPRYGGGHGYAHHEDGADRAFRNETEMDYYAGAARRGHAYSCTLLFGTTLMLLFSHWMS